MSTFDNVSINRAANIYFDGKVTSRTITFANGEVKTLGIMLPGEYTFNTDKKELMEIQAGKVEVQLAGSDKWKAYSGGESFEVPAQSSFNIKIKTIADYCCSFLD